MKKLLALIMVLCLFAVPVSAGADITSTNASLSVNGVTVSDFQTGYASIESTFKNNGDADAVVSVVIAEYTDADGWLKMNGVGYESKKFPQVRP